MTAFIDKMQFAIGYQLVELLAHKGRGDRVIISPDQQGRLFDLADLLAEVVTDGIFCQRDDLDGFYPDIDRFLQSVHQLLGGHCRIIESKLRFFPNVFVVAAFGVGVAHAAFEQAGTAGKDQGFDPLGVSKHVHQAYMPPEGIPQEIDPLIVAMFYESIEKLFQAADGGV